MCYVEMLFLFINLSLYLRFWNEIGEDKDVNLINF